MKHAIASTLLLSCLSGAAWAPSSWGQDWSGPYAAGFVGANKLSSSDETVVFDTNLDGQFNDTVNTFAGANAFSPGFCDASSKGTTPDQGCDEVDSETTYGVKAGYDWQTGNFVYGILAEISSAGLSDSVTAFSVTPASYVFRREIDSISAVRVRGGYAYNEWLIYGTAGMAWADIERKFITTNALNSFTATDADGDDDGYQVGIGFERTLNDQWALGLEYLRTSLKDEGPVVRVGPSANTLTSNPFLIVNNQGTDMKRTEDKIEIDRVVMTLTYRFGSF